MRIKVRPLRVTQDTNKPNSKMHAKLSSCSTPKRPASLTPPTSSRSLKLGEDIKSNINQGRMGTLSSIPEKHFYKKLRTEVPDADSNTTHSEPSTYVCFTCKARIHSAWRLVQHVQHSHGLKIYVESSASSSSCSSSSGASSPSNMPHHLSPPPGMPNSFSVAGLNHGPVHPAPLVSKQPLSLEPKLDFNSQVTRLVAGTINLGVPQSSSPTQRKHSPRILNPSSSLLISTSNNTSNGSNNDNNINSTNSAESRLERVSPKYKLKEALTMTTKSTDISDVKSNKIWYTCEYCPRKYRYFGNLEIHIIQMHMRVLPYKCALCKYAFDQSFKLKRHMKIHRTPEDRTQNADEDLEEEDEIDPKEGKAEDLSVPSPNLTNQSQSTSLGGGENQEEDQDNNTSILASQLKIQDDLAKGSLSVPPLQPSPDTDTAIKTERAEVPRGNQGSSDLILVKKEGEMKSKYKCEICSRLFKKHYNLEQHRKANTCEKKPYRCKLCVYTCKTNATLLRHMKIHGRTDEVVLRCIYCKIPFSKSSTFRKHLKMCDFNQLSEEEGSSTSTSSKKAR